MPLVRALPNVVAWWIVVTSNEPPPVVAPNPSAPKTNRIPPNHLSVVPAHLASSACVRVIVVIGLLSDPQAHRRSPGEVAASFGEVLAILSSASGMLEGAVADTLVGVLLGKCRHVGVPGHGAHPDGRSSGVVGVEVVLRGVLAMGGMEHC
ncbi:hypothetical protein RHGRI_032501 [Rhododendron griersonianum]|uniref:Uncharacterized protein n=1 Tax=Rhododendron griersonianum TaxID=479676 RepID=A0AAV6IC64_9ERIC|nr:hypothetical protein RHGRI_032501 [Rhododendron griersonianum]